MANSNFVVHNGLTVGPLTIDAATGSISTTGTVSVTGGLAVSVISKNDSSISINDTGTGSNVSINIDGVTEHILTADVTTLNGNLVLNATGYLTVPAGTSAQRPATATNGMMRYNSTITSFEGYYAGAWSSLGGVKSVDGKAYITAEASAGAGDDVIRVYAGDSGTSTQVAWASTSNVKILPTTETTSAGTGALQVAGGASIAGNAYVANNLYIGTTAFSKPLTVPTIIAVDNGSTYAQIAMVNTGANGSSDFAAYPDNGTDANGWVDMGIAGSTFSDPAYSITRPNDGYLITRPASNSFGGNLVIGTSEAGSYNDITFSVGSFYANAEVARFHGNVSTGGTLSLKQGTASTSTTTGALTVSGGVGITGKVYAGGAVNITDNTPSSSTTTGALIVTGGGGFGGDLRVGGNIYAASLNTVSSSQLSVTAPLVYLTGDPYPYNFDIGLYSHFIGGPANVYAHTGAVRNYTNGVWGFFSNVKVEPTGTVNWADPGLVWDKVKVGDFIIANTTASSSTTTGALQVAGGAGIAGAVYAGSTLNVTGLTTTAAITASGTVQPSGNATVALGTSSTYWGNSYLASITTNGITVAGQGITSGGALTLPSITKNGTNGTGDIGQSNNTFATVYATTFSGVSTTAKYADLAENYEGDKAYAPGTVVMFGGNKEVTLAEADTTAVAGVVSTNPAHLMNGGLTGATVVPLALQGRVPCNVIGPVKKGDLMVSAGFGFAKSSTDPKVGQVIGKALGDFTGAKGQIEVVVGRV